MKIAVPDPPVRGVHYHSILSFVHSVSQEQTVLQPVRRWPQIYFGVAVTTLASLLLELSLTRIFSVVFYYHFAFLAISIALFGSGRGRSLFVRGRRLARLPCIANLALLALAER